jgi:drug/metabolite transporter (DMT)-like permease
MPPFLYDHLGEFCALAYAFLWTLCTICWTSAGRRVGAMAVCFDRLVIGTAILLIYCKIALGTWIPLDASVRIWTILLVSGAIGFFLGDLCIFKAFVIIGPRLSLLLQSLTPIAVAVIAYFYLGEPLGPIKWLGMAVTLSGVVWVVLERPESPKETHHRKDFTWGIFLAAVTALLGAVSQVLAKQVLAERYYDPFVVTLVRVLGGVVCFPILFTIVGHWRQIGASFMDRRAVAVVFIGSVLGPFVGVALNMKSLALCSSGVAITLINTAPVMFLPFAVFLYKEKISPRAAIGAVVSVAGVALLML